MTPAIIADIFHAKLHTFNKQLYFPSNKMTVPEFIEANKDIINKAYEAMKKQYPEVEPGHRLYLQAGIKNYLDAECVL